MMKDLHFTTIESTQEYLKNNFNLIKKSHIIQDEGFLVSCQEQTQGIGRNGNQWTDFKNNLAFSLMLRPHPVLTLTSLEIALILKNFFKQEYAVELYLKWPNDLISTNKKKCGGIILHSCTDQFYIAGIGINLIKPTSAMDNINFSWDGLFNSESDLPANYQYVLPRQFRDYFLSHRIYNDSQLLKEDWKKSCFHLNQQVRVIEGINNSYLEGTFLGIGDQGEAQIKLSNNNELRSCFSGSLRVLTS